MSSPRLVRARQKIMRRWRTPAYAGFDALPWADDRIAQRLVAEFGPMTLEQIGAVLGMGREGVRQVEERALRKLNRLARIGKLNGLIDATPRRTPLHAGQVMETLCTLGRDNRDDSYEPEAAE